MTEAELPPATASGPAPTRIGNAERQQAMDALDVHMSAGRLDPDEYGERVGKASVARTTADLEPLFADLPTPHAAGPVTPTANGSANAGHGGPAGSTGSTAATGWAPTPGRMPLPASGGRGRQKHHGREPLGGRVGEVAVGLTPFIAVGLFFLTHFAQSWLFLLLVPIVGVIVYGRDDHKR